MKCEKSVLSHSCGRILWLRFSEKWIGGRVIFCRFLMRLATIRFWEISLKWPSYIRIQSSDNFASITISRISLPLPLSLSLFLSSFHSSFIIYFVEIRATADSRVSLYQMFIFRGSAEIHLDFIIISNKAVSSKPVSYTHLTLPTIYSV